MFAQIALQGLRHGCTSEGSYQPATTPSKQALRKKPSHATSLAHLGGESEAWKQGETKSTPLKFSGQKPNRRERINSELGNPWVPWHPHAYSSGIWLTTRSCCLARFTACCGPSCHFCGQDSATCESCRLPCKQNDGNGSFLPQCGQTNHMARISPTPPVREQEAA